MTFGASQGAQRLINWMVDAYGNVVGYTPVNSGGPIQNIGTRPISVFTGTGNVTMAAQQDVQVINKGTGAATTVTLPASPTLGQVATVKDGKGDANSNNITIQAASGNIDGSSSVTISTNYGVERLIYNGTQWNAI